MYYTILYETTKSSTNEKKNWIRIDDETAVKTFLNKLKNDPTVNQQTIMVFEPKADKYMTIINNEEKTMEQFLLDKGLKIWENYGKTRRIYINKPSMFNFSESIDTLSRADKVSIYYDCTDKTFYYNKYIKRLQEKAIKEFIAWLRTELQNENEKYSTDSPPV